jgi:septal ring factor EnvC (AmiA/AmiB activator)
VQQQGSQLRRLHADLRASRARESKLTHALEAMRSQALHLERRLETTEDQMEGEREGVSARESSVSQQIASERSSGRAREEALRQQLQAESVRTVPLLRSVQTRKGALIRAHSN